MYRNVQKNLLHTQNPSHNSNFQTFRMFFRDILTAMPINVYFWPLLKWGRLFHGRASFLSSLFRGRGGGPSSPCLAQTLFRALQYPLALSQTYMPRCWRLRCAFRHAIIETSNLSDTSAGVGRASTAGLSRHAVVRAMQADITRNVRADNRGRHRRK